MAERVVHLFIDDMDGSEIPEGGGGRIEFSVRGAHYQIDLSSANTAKFDKALKPFITAAEKVDGAARPQGRKAEKKSRTASPKEHLAAVRDWARESGYEVSERGRIKAEIVQAYQAAH